MGTPASISVDLGDGQIISVYQHFDGYPSYTEDILNKFFNSKEKALELVNGGDISSITRQGQVKYYAKRSEWEEGHENEPWNKVKPEESASFQGVKNKFDGVDYHYVFKDGKWEVHRG